MTNTQYTAFDAYGFRHLVDHLARSRQFEELHHLLFDYPWLQSKLDATDPYTLIVDMGYLPDDSNLCLVQSAIRMSTYVLAKDKTQLGSQLLGRLLNESAPEITDLLRSVIRDRGDLGPWLRPLARCLPLGSGFPIAWVVAPHIDMISGLAFTPDGSKLISWDCDAFCAWSSDRLEFLGRERAPGTSTIERVLPMSDNKRIAFSMSDYLNNQIFMWDIENKETSVILMKSDPIRTFAIAGDFVFVVGERITPEVWTVSNGDWVGVLPYDTTLNDACADTRNGTYEYTLYEKPERIERPRIERIAVTPDGTAIIGVALGYQKSWLCRWSLPERELIFTQPLEGFRAGEIYVTPDSRWCIVTGGKNVRVLDAFSGKPHCVFEGHADSVLGIAVDDDWVYSTSEDGLIKIWDLNNGQCLHTFRNPGIRNLATNLGGLLATDRHYCYIHIWQRRSLQLLEQAEIDLPGPIKDVAIDSTATLVLMVAHNSLPLVWSNNSLITIPLQTSVDQVAISHDGRYLFFAISRAIAIWSVTERRVVGNLGDIGQEISFLETADNGNILVAYRSGKIKIWRLTDDNDQICLAEGQVSNSVCSISPNGQYAVCADSHLYDVKSGNRIRKIPAELEVLFCQRERTVNKVAISGDGSRVAVAVGSWRLRGGSDILVERLQGEHYNPNGSAEVNTTTSQGDASAFVASFPYQIDNVTDLAFSYDGKKLLICDMGGVLRLWNIDTGQIICHYCSSVVRCCDISRDGNLILAGDDDGFINLLSLETHSSPTDIVESINFGFPLFSKIILELGTSEHKRLAKRSKQQEYGGLQGNLEQPTAQHVARRDKGSSNSAPQELRTKAWPGSIQSYHGIVLAEPESTFLCEMEDLLGVPIPLYFGTGKTEFGFRVENQHVVELYCSGKNLSYIPDSICNLQAINVLDLQDNHLGTLPEEIGNLRSLTRLNLRLNQITALPESIGNLRALISLNLQSNRIIALPMSIENLQALEELIISINSILSLPEGIGRLSNLRHLDLNTNQISRLSEEIGRLKNLQHLDLHSNQISFLPESIGDLQVLTELFINENRLVALPKSLWTLKALRKLRLDCNELVSFPEEIRQLQELNDLDLLGNRITFLPEKVHRALRSLEEGGCRVRLGPMPFREFLHVFFPIAFDPNCPEIIWWFDLDGYLTKYNLITLQEIKTIQISQPGLILSHFAYQDSLGIMDSDGTFQVYSLRNRTTIHKFCFRVTSDQRLAAAKLNQLDRIALIYTRTDHSPATLVLHDPIYSQREVAKIQLGFGYFLSVSLEIDDDGNFITMQGEPPRDVVKLDRESLRILRHYRGSTDYPRTIKLIGNLLFAANPIELLIWNYSTGELVFRGEFGLVDSIDWSSKYRIVFICTRTTMVLLDLNTGTFLGSFDKAPSLDSIAVSNDGELLFLGRRGYGDERAAFEKETPMEINLRLELLSGLMKLPKESIPLTEVCSLRKIQVWQVTDVLRYCQSMLAK